MDGTHLFYVSKIAEAALSGNQERTAAYLRQFADHLRSSGNEKEADRLTRIIDKAPSRVASLTRQQSGRVIPVDSESAFAIADKEFVAKGSVPVVLSDSHAATIRDFLAYIAEAYRLEVEGVAISPTMLLHGPPGSGKTQIARYIASELGLPLITARTDGLISSYLGSTAKNVRKLFEFAKAEPCVLFLDEFDAVAKKRDDSRELGELKRVVISLLQNIDTLGKDHVLLAATNHEHLLDSAIWRRFTYRLHVGLPDAEMRAALIRIFFHRYLDEQWAAALESLSDGLSGAQIKMIAEDTIRASILRGDGIVTPQQVVAAFLRERGQQSGDRNEIIRALRDRGFSQQTLGRLFGISQPAVSKILNKETHGGGP